MTYSRKKSSNLSKHFWENYTGFLVSMTKLFGRENKFSQLLPRSAKYSIHIFKSEIPLHENKFKMYLLTRNNNDRDIGLTVEA